MSVAADRFAVGPALDQPLDFVPKSRWTVLRRIVSQPKGAIGAHPRGGLSAACRLRPDVGAGRRVQAEFRRHTATPLRSALVRHRPARARRAKPCPRRRSRDARDRGWRGRARVPDRGAARRARRVAARLGRRGRHARRRRHAELSGHRVRACHRRDPRRQHAERDRRGGYRVDPGLRPHRAGCHAQHPRRALYRGDDLARRLAGACRPSSRPAEHLRHAADALDPPVRLDAALGLRPRLPRARRAAAISRMGHDAGRKPLVYPQPSPSGDLPRPVPRRLGAGVQPSRGRVAHRLRSDEPPHRASPVMAAVAAPAPRCGARNFRGAARPGLRELPKLRYADCAWPFEATRACWRSCAGSTWSCARGARWRWWASPDPASRHSFVPSPRCSARRRSRSLAGHPHRRGADGRAFAAAAARPAPTQDRGRVSGRGERAQPGPHRRRSARRGSAHRHGPQTSRRPAALHRASLRCRHFRSGAPARHVSAPVLGRHEAAHRHRDRAGPGSARAARGRTYERARRHHPAANSDATARAFRRSAAWPF